MKQTYHFFTSSALNWQRHELLSQCLKFQKKFDTSGSYYKANYCGVWRVPTPPADEASGWGYAIDNYAPAHEGAVFLGYFAHNKTGEKTVLDLQGVAL